MDCHRLLNVKSNAFCLLLFPLLLVCSVSDPKAHYIGTEPWKPKEALEEGVITDKSDIFAYGLTLWEMMTLSMPHLQMLDEEDDEDEGAGSIFYDTFA